MKHIEIRPRIPGSTRVTGNETQGDLMHMWDIYVGAPNVTGEEKFFGPDPDRTRGPPHKNPIILPRRYINRLVPQGSTSVYIHILCDII